MNILNQIKLEALQDNMDGKGRYLDCLYTRLLSIRTMTYLLTAEEQAELNIILADYAEYQVKMREAGLI